ncbi:hypothetical protein V8G54_002009 [Vigna mungo]|uniref:Uncharacterized protein n=1 Tax=Vigna mungo TaxID=3915 RepID=A0AAQ3P9C6_VIGMU
MHNNGLLTSWESFLRALELRFAPSKFEDPIAALCKLSQTHSLQDYLSELKPHLRREVTVLQPTDLNQVISFAKLHDDKQSAFPFSRFSKPPSQTQTPPPPIPKSLPPLLPTPPIKLPIKRLTKAEMQARKEKNLCYNCDERYTRGHRCKSQFLLLISTTSDDDPLPLDDPDPLTTEDPSSESGLISLHALCGQWVPRTLRLTGSINGYQVQILVDSGATHNFIQSRVAHFLQLHTEPTPTPLKVMVGNGDFLPCSTLCPKAQLKVASFQFSVDLYPLELSGTDIVLGVHWLTQVSPFAMDYNGPFMRFMWEGTLVELKGETGPTPSPISIHQLRRLQQTNSVEALYQLTLDQPPSYHSYSLTTASILMLPADCAKTAFRTHNGHFEFKVMPSGLCNAPSTFQATTNDLFRPHLRQFIIVFFDDILVYSPTLDSHVSHLESTFQLLLQHSFKLKGDKCSIGKESIHYLGHIVARQGVHPDPNKIQVVLDWPLPTSVKSLRGFLGLTGFYRRFVKGYASIANALTDLLKRDNFVWHDTATKAFQRLKDALTNAPVLALPRLDCTFLVQTDASSSGMGAVLSQNGHPIAYFSKQFCPKLQNSFTYIRELCAITSAVQKWRQYLLGRRFIIQTDQKSIKELLSQTVLTSDQQTYLSKLLAYDFEIQYKSGKTNSAADAFAEFLDLKHKIAATPAHFPLYSIVDGLILFKKRIWIPASCPFIPTLLHEYHSTPIVGHPGVARTFGKLAANFFWDKMREDIHSFVTQCVICQQTKIPAQKPAGLLQPIPPPSKCWEDLSLDFIIGLPSYQGHTTILVVVDRFYKGAHFGTLPRSFSASKVADLFVHMICRLHGLPKSLISDRDSLFLSQFWRELFRYPLLIIPNPTDNLRWSTRFCNNTSVVSFITNLRCGANFFLGLNVLPSDTSNAAVQFELQSRTDIIRKLNRNLQKAQSDIKKWAYTSRRDLQLQEGDWAYVRHRPYHQVSVAGPYQGKLQKHFFGPFKVLERIGQVAYRLELPSTAKIHNVFHISFLRPHLGLPPTSVSALPLEFQDNHPLLEPITILATKPDSDTVLVQWKGLPPEEATWEPRITIQQQFHLEDKVLLHPEGDERNTEHVSTTSTNEECIDSPSATTDSTAEPGGNGKNIEYSPSIILPCCQFSRFFFSSQWWRCGDSKCRSAFGSEGGVVLDGGLRDEVMLSRGEALTLFVSDKLCVVVLFQAQTRSGVAVHNVLITLRTEVNFTLTDTSGEMNVLRCFNLTRAYDIECSDSLLLQEIRMKAHSFSNTHNFSSYYSPVIIIINTHSA